MPEVNDLTVNELRTKARANGLPIGDSKAELIARLTDFDPTGGWMDSGDKVGEQSIELGASGKVAQAGARNDEDFRRERELTDRETELELTRREREIEFNIRERELMRQELELARREINILRRNEHTSVIEGESRIQEAHENAATLASHLSTGMNLKMIAELVSEFDGTPDMFNV